MQKKLPPQFARPQNLPLPGRIGCNNFLHASEKSEDAWRFQKIVNCGAFFSISHDAGIFKYGQMLRNRGHVGTDHFGEFIDAPLAPGKLLNNEKSAGMRHRLDDSGLRFVTCFLKFGLHNFTIWQYSKTFRFCQYYFDEMTRSHWRRQIFVDKKQVIKAMSKISCI